MNNPINSLTVPGNHGTITLSLVTQGMVELYHLRVTIEVEETSFLHIGAAPSPLSEKKGAVFKVDRTPVIPATSFKGVLRNQMELLLIKNRNDFGRMFNIESDILKPCIPAPTPTQAEKSLKGYREKLCQINIDDEQKKKLDNEGICPVCYFMGAAGLMGFLRFPNFFPAEEGDWLIDQTNIRIDRKILTAAARAKVDGEQVKPGTKFVGVIEIINKTAEGFEFGLPREIANEQSGNLLLDKWLAEWQEKDTMQRKRLLLEKIVLPALNNIHNLGGYKSRGAGKVRINLVEG